MLVRQHGQTHLAGQGSNTAATDTGGWVASLVATEILQRLLYKLPRTRQVMFFRLQETTGCLGEVVDIPSFLRWTPSTRTGEKPGVMI
jgi:hypothetical protein